MGGSDMTYSGCSGVIIWEWTKICPECKANQEEWEAGSKKK